ncbi:MAG: hypothetical protein U0326_08850 [Polyangiales bacterium]
MMGRSVLAVCSALALGCVAGADVSSQGQAIAIPGPWVPSPITRAVAATQHVTVVDPPAVAPLGHCTSTNAFACSCTHPACMVAHPGTRDLNAFLLRRYSFLRAGGTYCCRQNSAMTRVPMLSVHSVGRAMDLMVPMTGGDADNTLGDAVANWLVENAEYIGIQRVIWDRAYWNGEHGFGLLTAASLPHTDHVHVELSVAGAERRTAFFTSGAAMGTTCAARCDGTRLINADCTSVDCASTGAACVDGAAPRCGTPAPPEPAEAMAVPGATIPTVRAAAAPGRFTFVGPTRLFDTRTPSESTRLVRSGAAGPVAPASNGTFRDWAPVGLPAGATGVWLNVAAIGVGAPGFATAFAAGEPRPPTSTVNYIADAANANATPAVLGASGGVTFESIAPAHLIVDAYGAFSPTGAGIAPSGPTRVLDTRSDVALVAGVPRPVDVSPPAGAVGVVASVAVIAGAEGASSRPFPCGAAVPPTSNINFGANAVVTNTVVSTLGGGQLCLRSNVSTHVVVDVTGFFYADERAHLHRACAAAVLLDTREPRVALRGPPRRPSGHRAARAAHAGDARERRRRGRQPHRGRRDERRLRDGFSVRDARARDVVAQLPRGPARWARSRSRRSGAGRSACVRQHAQRTSSSTCSACGTGAASTPTPPPPVDEGDDIPPDGLDAGVDGSAPGVDASAVSARWERAVPDGGGVRPDGAAAPGDGARRTTRARWSRRGELRDGAVTSDDVLDARAIDLASDAGDFVLDSDAARGLRLQGRRRRPSPRARSRRA